jgi:hypothetical protein
MSDRTIRGWAIDATCPRCGGPLTHVADGQPDGVTSRAIAGCDGCGHEFAVQVTIADIGRAVNPDSAAARGRRYRQRQREAAA